MRRSGMPGRRLWPTISVAMVMSFRAASTPASDGNKLQCIEAHEQAQVLRQAGHLRAARQKLLVCTRSVCPTVVQQECGGWLQQVDVALPTVVLSVHDQRGSDVTAVRISVDGELLVERLDGRPVAIDPGPHTLRFEVAGEPPLERPWGLREGEKDRAIVVGLPSPSPPAIAVPSAPPPPAPAEQERASSSANVVVGAVA